MAMYINIRIVFRKIANSNPFESFQSVSPLNHKLLKYKRKLGPVNKILEKCKEERKRREQSGSLTAYQQKITKWYYDIKERKWKQIMNFL